MARYKVMYKRKGEKKWLTCRNDDYSRIKYFSTRAKAKKYASYLSSFKTKVVKV